MKQANQSIKYVFGVWGAIALLSGLAALLRYAVFSHFSREIIAPITTVAAGGILAMIPEAFELTPLLD